jgi:hypothetical protein
MRVPRRPARNAGSAACRFVPAVASWTENPPGEVAAAVMTAKAAETRSWPEHCSQEWSAVVPGIPS